MPQVAADQLSLTLNGPARDGSRLELSRLSEKFKDGAPEVQKVQAQIDQAAAGPRRARAPDRGRPGGRAGPAAPKREAEIRAAIDGQKGQAARDSRKATELETRCKKSRSPRRASTRSCSRSSTRRDIAASIRSNNVTMVERAAPPQRPVRPAASAAIAPCWRSWAVSRSASAWCCVRD